MPVPTQRGPSGDEANGGVETEWDGPSVYLRTYLSAFLC